MLQLVGETSIFVETAGHRSVPGSYSQLKQREKMPSCSVPRLRARRLRRVLLCDVTSQFRAQAPCYKIAAEEPENKETTDSSVINDVFVSRRSI